MRRHLFAKLIAIAALTVALMVFAVSAPQITALTAQAQQSEAAPEAQPRAGTGGAQTLDDILRRQRGEDVPLDQAPSGPRAGAPVDSPLGIRGGASDPDLWRAIRRGEELTTVSPTRNAGLLVQDEGQDWLAFRAGPLREYSLYAMGGMVIMLALFFLLRGRIKVDAGLSGIRIERFKFLERFGHWTLAVSFILLALTGLNLLYGRAAVDAIYGTDATPERMEALATFADVTLWGKWVHNNIAWPFMLSLALIFVMWVLRNIPNWTDVKWLAQGGGIFSKGKHPPAWKFNAGQKIVFWAVILLGVSVSASGLSLLFPYEMPMFAPTFEKLNGLSAAVGAPLALSTELTAIQEMQYAQTWHTIVAVVMIVVVLAHIYIGTVGMQGAFSAMGSGKVDLNWAKEHHGLWVDELKSDGELHIHPDGQPRPAATPAE